MTVSNQTNRTSAVGNDAIGQEVAFTFPYNATSDLTVISRVTLTGVETTLAETTNYTLTAASETGGTLTTVTAVAATSQIHIIRDTPMTQSLDLEQGGSFNAENIEDALDKNTKLAIESKDKLSFKAIKFPETDNSSLENTLPSSVDRASKVFSFDSAGNATASTAVPAGSVSFTAFGTSMAEAATVNTARTLLDLNYIDLRDYGAKGDGVTDDTASLESAIAASVSSRISLYVPNGTYKLTNKIDIPEYLVMIGDHKMSTTSYLPIFYGDHTDTIFEMEGTGKGVSLSGFSVGKRDAYEGTGIGIKFYSATDVNDRWVLSNIGIFAVSTGLHVEDAIFSIIENMVIVNTDIGILSTNSDVNTGNHDCIFRDIWISVNEYGIKLLGYNHAMLFDRVKLFYSTVRCIYADADGEHRQNTFKRLWLEQNTMGVGEGLIELLSGVEWVFDGIMKSENQETLFEPTMTAAISKQISISNVMDIGALYNDMGIGYLTINNGGTADTLQHPYTGRLSDEVQTSNRSFTISSNRTVKGETVFGKDIVSPAYQSGIKRTNYMINQNPDTYTKSNLTVTTEQDDPYGGFGAYKITETTTEGYLYKPSIAVDGGALTGRTFTFQMWVKANTTSDVVKLMVSTPVGGIHLSDTIWHLDREGWNLIWVTHNVKADDTSTTLRIWVFPETSPTDANTTLYIHEPCLYETDKPCIFSSTDEPDGYTVGEIFERNYGIYRNKSSFGEILFHENEILSYENEILRS